MKILSHLLVVFAVRRSAKKEIVCVTRESVKKGALKNKKLNKKF
jgi:hypothetical protein